MTFPKKTGSPFCGILLVLAWTVTTWTAMGGDGLPERYVAVDNVCAWPKLVLLKDGTIAATLHNRPTHGLVEGGLETWISTDGGRLWNLAGTPAPPDPDTVRMGIAVGLGNEGSLLVLASGWDQVTRHPSERPMLQPLISRSRDNGKTWERSPAVVNYPAGVDVMRPWGPIIALPDKRLAAPFYHSIRLPQATRTSYLLFSADNGRTWGDAALIGRNYNETATLRLYPQRWLAAARSDRGNLDLFLSEDEGRTWKFQSALTEPREHPGQLLRLGDGRILLIYGIRKQDLYGIGVRVSQDEGKTWEAPKVLVRLEGTTDGGYPWTVQLADGTLVTAYYSDGVPAHQRYHMGVYRWSAEELGNNQRPRRTEQR